MQVTVTVTLKKGVLDPQGKAIEGALHALGFPGASDVNVGKIISITLPETATDQDLKTMCEKLLSNPVIEDYEIEKNI